MWNVRTLGRRIGMSAAPVMLSLCAIDGAAAQDVGGVFDMGQLTGTLAMDHVTQSERARARRVRDTPSSSSARTRASCAKVPGLRVRYGASDLRIVRVTRICRQLGYSTR